jgi:hypothetical protein
MREIFDALAAAELAEWMDLAREMGQDPALVEDCLTPEDVTLALAEDMLRG